MFYPLVLRVFTPDFWLKLSRNITENAIQSAIQMAGILIAYLVLRKVLNSVIDSVLTRVLTREQNAGASDARTGRLQTIRGLCKSVVGYVLLFVFGVLFLKAVGFDILPFITTAGVIGLAIGFGAQKLVKDVISGFFIIIDNVYSVGEMVTIVGVTGEVQEMGMRITRLLDVSGKLHLISNGDIAMVTNLSRYPVRDFVEVTVAANTDLNAAVKAIRDAGQKLVAQEGRHLKEAPVVTGISAFSAAGVTIRVGVLSDQHDFVAEQMAVRGALREALLAAGIQPA